MNKPSTGPLNGASASYKDVSENSRRTTEHPNPVTVYRPFSTWEDKNTVRIFIDNSVVDMVVGDAEPDSPHGDPSGTCIPCVGNSMIGVGEWRCFIIAS